MKIVTARPVVAHAAIAQDWEESERGWGVRPDGTTIHRTRADRDTFVQAYWDRQPSGPVPDEYSRPCGEPYEVSITKEAWNRLGRVGSNGDWAMYGEIIDRRTT